MNEQVCVYTALLGGYEQLNPQPMARESADRWICFTDDPELRSKDWEVVLIEPVFPFDPHRSSRYLKMLGHPLVRESSMSLWIDNSVRLTAPPGRMLREWLKATDIAHMEHSYRETVLDEFVAVLDDGLDDSARILEQLDHYARSRPEVLDERPLCGGIIARRSSPDVDAAMHLWWQHLLRYSRRDQLSLNLAVRAARVDVTRISIDNFESEWHTWPVVGGRNESMRRWVRTAPAPPTADLLLSQRRLGQARVQLEHVEQQMREALEEGTRELEEVRTESVRRLEQAEDLAKRLSTAEEHIATMEDRRVAETEHLRALIALGDDRSEEMRGNIEQLEQIHIELLAQRDDLRTQLQALQSSHSWRIGQSIVRLSQPHRFRR